MVWVENASPQVDAQSQYPTIIIICIVLSTLSITIISIRLWIRARSRGLGADDYLAGLSMIFALIYSVLCIVQTKFGLGLPIALRPPQDKIAYTRVNFAGRPIYQLGISFFKIALLISYLRLLQGTNERMYCIVIMITITVIFLAHLGCALSLILACTPVHKSWDPNAPGTCLAAGPSFKGYAIVSIVSDILVTLILIPFLVRQNLNSRKKAGLCGVFLLGLFTTVCSILRYLQINRVAFGDGNSTMLVLWGTVEFNVGNMVSSLPFLAPIVVRKAKEYRDRSNQPSEISNPQSGNREVWKEEYHVRKNSQGNAMQGESVGMAY